MNIEDLNTLDWESINQESLNLYKGLLQLDTTNPPGNERIATAYLADALAEDGIDSWIVESAPGRANLVARLAANVEIDDDRGPLLLAGHTDVVPANADEWTHPPFGAVEQDGFIWARGALDMKNMVAMSAMIMKLFARYDIPRNRDLIFAAVADEEEGCTYGSRFLVNSHPDRVRAEYMLGEVGGFWLHIGDTTYVPIQVAEKGQVHLRMRASGPPGHGSMPRQDNSLLVLSQAIAKLGATRLPYHMTPIMERFIDELAQSQPKSTQVALKGLKSSALAHRIIDHVLPDKAIARNFDALLHNTVSPTIVHAGQKRNMIPDEAVCEMDGRILPGFSAGDLRREVQRVVGKYNVDVEVVSGFEGVALDKVESDLYHVITQTVAHHAPHTQCIPYMVSGYTDAQNFSRLGTKCYGFSPLMIPADAGIKFAELFHGIDERVPTEGYLWGQRVLFDVVSTFLKR